MQLIRSAIISLLQGYADRSIKTDILVGGIATVIAGIISYYYYSVFKTHPLEAVTAMLFFWGLWVAVCYGVQQLSRRTLAFIGV